MKRLLLAASLLTAATLSPVSQADWNDRGYRTNAYHFGAPGRNFGVSRVNHSFVSVGWGRHEPYWNRGLNHRSWNRGLNHRGWTHRSWNRGWNRRFDHRWNSGLRYRTRSNSDFVGGLLLGSVLAAPLSYSALSTVTTAERRVIRPAPVVRRTREVVTVRPSRSTFSSTPRRRLLRDLAGDCFEITTTNAGDELRQQIDAQNCNY